MIEKLNLRETYKDYKQSVENPVDIKVYLYIVTGFIQFLVKKLLDGFDIQLAGGRSLGTIGVRGKKLQPRIDAETGEVVGLSVDWGKTNKLWRENPECKANKQFVYFTNEHSNGIRYNFMWWKAGMQISNKYLYSLWFCKPNRRKLSALIKEESKEYLVI